MCDTLVNICMVLISMLPLSNALFFCVGEEEGGVTILALIFYTVFFGNNSYQSQHTSDKSHVE